jgi:hypothetical protein
VTLVDAGRAQPYQLRGDRLARQLLAGLYLPDPRQFDVTQSPRPKDQIGAQILGCYYGEAKRAKFIQFRPDGTVFLSLGGSPALYAVDGTSVVIALHSPDQRRE